MDLAAAVEGLASAVWDPFLCLFYLVVGSFLAWVIRGVAWRGLWPAVTEALRAPGRPGELSARDGMLAALGASVGVGNLAGVATALHLGGPGALFWMWVSAVVGMHFRFASTYLAVHHRPDEPNDPAYATPMSYLERLAPGGRPQALPAVVAALLVAVGFLNANLIQSNSVAHAVSHLAPISPGLVAIGLTLLIGAVTLGGLRAIVRWSVRLTPWMLAAYVIAGLTVLLGDAPSTARALAAVLDSALRPSSVLGGAAGAGVLGAMRFGVSRGIFSHGCGMGMAPFFQARGAEGPARAATLAAVVPLFDTLIVCTITGLVILTRGDWLVRTGAYLTASSFTAGLGDAGRLVVLASLGVFAFTTMVSWAHFAERAFEYLGGRARTSFRLAFAAACFAGPFLPVALVWTIGDLLVAALFVAHAVPLVLVAITAQSVLVPRTG